MNPALVLIVAIIVLLLLGVPIGISLGLGILAVIATHGLTTINFVAQYMYTGIESFPLIAIPCFMLAGSIMETGGLSKRLVSFASSLVGGYTGALGCITVLACMFFGAISGSAPATAAAIGSIMIPHMLEARYEEHYSAGLITAAGGLGVIVPPSIPMVIYGLTCSVSISSMFIAGILPACLVGLCLIVTSWICSKKRGYVGTGEKVSGRKVLHEFKDAIWALIMPVIILGGIYSGVFTPTEAAVIAIVYGLLIGLFVYKELKLKAVGEIFLKTTSLVGGMLITFAPAGALGAVLAMIGVPRMLTAFLLSISSNINVILIIINIFLIFIGMLMDVNSAIIIFGSLFYNVLVTNLGMDPLHFGVMFIVNLCIGFVTPPVAPNLFVVSTMTKLPAMKIAKASIPFLIALFVALLFITYVPAISTFLPNMLLGQ